MGSGGKGRVREERRKRKSFGFRSGFDGRKRAGSGGKGRAREEKGGLGRKRAGSGGKEEKEAYLARWRSIFSTKSSF